jgi:threonyl-tRNA synthetase
MDLFCFSDLVGSGLPLFTPRGTIIREELQKEIEKICKRYKFEKVITPHLAKIDLYKISGHADKFSEELFKVTSERKHDFALKPVQCPHQTQIYKSKTRSYKDLPIRYMESEKQYRAELSGAVSGLSRVYAITVEDGHSFCRVDQIKQEVINMINIIKDFYNNLGLFENFWVSLSVRDYNNLQNYIGDLKDWDKSEQMLEEISKELNLNAKRCEGEAALYGPKLDFMFKDALGKEIQIPTVQLDFATPKKFELTYVNENNEEVNPVMIHRAILGSYERLFVLLIEHFAGKFPLWLSPVQVKIINVADRHIDYCNKIKEKLEKEGFRVESDYSHEGVGKKIAMARKHDKPNYMLILGDKDIENKTISVRTRKIVDGKNEEFTTNIDEFLSEIVKERNDKKIK